MRARGLKHTLLELELTNPDPSRPMRARGLKPSKRYNSKFSFESRPMRARGLKHFTICSFFFNDVAPHAGAWVET